MKIVKVRLRRGAPGENMMLYPSRYNAQEVDRQGVYAIGLPVQDALSGGIGMGDVEEWCLIALPSALATEYAQDADMEIITETKANTLMAGWRTDRLVRGAHGERAIRITDQARLDIIREKRDAGAINSTEDDNALDPDNPELGINSGPRTVPKALLTR